MPYCKSPFGSNHFSREGDLRQVENNAFKGDREFGKNTLQDGSSVQSGADSRGSDAETLGGCGGLP